MAISVLICLTDVMYFSAAKHYGAGVTTRIEPLSVLTAFVGWSLLKPQELHRFIDQPVTGVLIALCFAGAGFFALRLRHCEVSSAVMRRLLPAVGIMALITMLGKTAMDAGRFPLDSAIAYVIVQCSIVIAVYGIAGLFFTHKTGSLRPNRGLIASALAMGFFSLTHILVKNIAYTHVSNPAYVTVVVLSAPLFVAGFYRWSGRRDDTDVRAGFGIVACALALVVLTRF